MFVPRFHPISMFKSVAGGRRPIPASNRCRMLRRKAKSGATPQRFSILSKNLSNVSFPLGAWGEVQMTRKTLTLTVLQGALEIRKVGLPTGIRPIRASIGGTPVSFDRSENNLILKSPQTLDPSHPLEIQSRRNPAPRCAHKSPRPFPPNSASFNANNPCRKPGNHRTQ